MGDSIHPIVTRRTVRVLVSLSHLCLVQHIPSRSPHRHLARVACSPYLSHGRFNTAALSSHRWPLRRSYSGIMVSRQASSPRSSSDPNLRSPLQAAQVAKPVPVETQHEDMIVSLVESVDAS